MKTAPLLLVVLLVALGGGLLYQFLFPPAGAAGAESGVSSGDLNSLREQIALLVEENAKLHASIRSLQARLNASSPGVAARSDQPDVQSAVDDWMRANRPDLLAAAQAAAAGASADAEASPRERVAALLMEMGRPGVSENEREAIWKRIREAGLLDEAIAVLEEYAQANPDDPDAQLGLADGYFQKTTENANTAEAGIWATKADQALDAALEIAPQHWGARFTKAIGLSFWPPVMGKQGEAVRHFEILIDQQRGQPARPEFAQTYLFLGNMHQQMGDHEKAWAVWQEGLNGFPDSAELRQQLDNAVQE